MNISIPRTILQVPFMMSDKMFLPGCSCIKPLDWDSLLVSCNGAVFQSWGCFPVLRGYFIINS